MTLDRPLNSTMVKDGDTVKQCMSSPHIRWNPLALVWSKYNITSWVSVNLDPVWSDLVHVRVEWDSKRGSFSKFCTQKTSDWMTGYRCVFLLKVSAMSFLCYHSVSKRLLISNSIVRFCTLDKRNNCWHLTHHESYMKYWPQQVSEHDLSSVINDFLSRRQGSLIKLRVNNGQLYRKQLPGSTLTSAIRWSHRVFQNILQLSVTLVQTYSKQRCRKLELSCRSLLYKTL